MRTAAIFFLKKSDNGFDTSSEAGLEKKKNCPALVHGVSGFLDFLSQIGHSTINFWQVGQTGSDCKVIGEVVFFSFFSSPNQSQSNKVIDVILAISISPQF